jgi:hypothetical protein
VETRTPGSASGLGKRIGSNPDTAPRADSTRTRWLSPVARRLVVGVPWPRALQGTKWPRGQGTWSGIGPVQAVEEGRLH